MRIRRKPESFEAVQMQVETVIRQAEEIRFNPGDWMLVDSSGVISRLTNEEYQKSFEAEPEAPAFRFDAMGTRIHQLYIPDGQGMTGNPLPLPGVTIVGTGGNGGNS